MKSLIQFINESIIVEMAYSRSEYITLVSNLDEQILQNYALVYYCNIYDKCNINLNHWKSELKALVCRIIKKKIKTTNKLSIIKYVIIDKDELNTYSEVRLYIEQKLRKENISDNIIHEICLYIKDNIYEICDLLNSNNENEVMNKINNI